MQRGFTLIELLMVVAVVGILAAITLSVSAGARERAARDRARAELAVIAAALEQYRAAYGAYPQVADDGAGLLAALSGELTPTGEPADRRPFLSLDGFALDETGARLVDPWQQPIFYQPFQPGVRSGFRLYSLGPDGDHLPPSAEGLLDENADENLDNVIHGR